MAYADDLAVVVIEKYIKDLIAQLRQLTELLNNKENKQSNTCFIKDHSCWKSV